MINVSVREARCRSSRGCSRKRARALPLSTPPTQMSSSSWVPTVLAAYLDALESSYAAGGLMRALLSVPGITLTAIHDVPSQTFNLNSVAWALSVALILLITPIAFITGLQCIFAVAAGPARKTLSTLFNSL